MTIEQELSIIKDNIAEYGQTNITQEEYNMIYNKAIDDFADYVLDQFAPLFTKEELIKNFTEQLKG